MTIESLQNLGDDSAIQRTAELILRAYRAYRWHFMRITLRAKSRFENRQWSDMQQDAVERLELYSRVVRKTTAKTLKLMGTDTRNKNPWSEIKRLYSGQTAADDDIELAETFFNSLTRQIFTTAGVDPEIEYVHLESASPHATGPHRLVHTYSNDAGTLVAIRRILDDCSVDAPFCDFDRDARLVAQEIESHWSNTYRDHPIDAFEVMAPVFYRGQGAYIVGRIRGHDYVMPLAISLNHPPEGVTIDAVLLTTDELSILFSFTRSYFHVSVEHPHEMIRFLKAIMPRKPIAELYTAIGFNKHGKTEFYRDLLRHLDASSDKFEISAGARGMVMVVFTLPSYDVVFKVIRDYFEPPKNTTHEQVREKYRLVFKQDRAGRLVDAQEFEFLEFDENRFSDALLRDLREFAADSVSIHGGKVVIRHLYTERRVRPLNLYLEEAGEHAACRAAVDYGQSIKDLAATNIFPGDLPVKNFGVTRHGRVIFYDYDELTLLEECNFRDIPRSRYDEDEMQAEPWFFVGPHDIFPEEFAPFLGLQDKPRECFMDHHADLLTAAFWKKLQDRHAAGEAIEIRPYPPGKRLQSTSEDETN